ncbi:MAG TPA: Ku protein [Devosia sp.]|jgi:non-homologous end joining protein Ku|nr:Ku protein [Devosia sp.]
MAPRAQWNGFLRLSLVSCSVSLYPAISPAERVSFRQVNRETGNRLRQQLVDTVTGQVVDTAKRGRGYEVGGEQFVVIPDEDLRQAQLEARSRPFSQPAARAEEDEPEGEPIAPPARKSYKSAEHTAEEPKPRPAEANRPQPVPRPIIENTHTIELDRFIPREEIDARYLLAPYYIAPRDEISLEAYSVIREAMAHEGLVGMGRVVLANRERPLIVEPMGLGLRAFTLHYAHELRSEVDYFKDIRPLDLPQEVLDVTELILNTKREHFDPAYLEDRYRTLLVEKLREKTAAAPAKAATSRPSAQNVINLMDALKASLAQAKPPAPSKTRRSSAKPQKVSKSGGNRAGRSN